MVGIFVAPGVDFFDTLRSAPRIRVTLEGKRLFDTPIGGSDAAIDYFEQCSRELKVGPFRA